MARRRRARARSSVGSIGTRAQTKIEGFEELLDNLKRLSDMARVEILDKAVDEGGDEALGLMAALAPRSEGSGTRGYHGADRLQKSKIWSRRDSRATAVGIHRGNAGAWFLKFAELGTIFVPEQSFIKPTAKVMRPRMIEIIIKHWRATTRKAIRVKAARR